MPPHRFKPTRLYPNPGRQVSVRVEKNFQYLKCREVGVAGSHFSVKTFRISLWEELVITTATTRTVTIVTAGQVNTNSGRSVTSHPISSRNYSVEWSHVKASGIGRNPRDDNHSDRHQTANDDRSREIWLNQAQCRQQR